MQASRNIFLSEPDVTLYTNNIIFKPGKQDRHGGRYIFEYVVAADYSDTLIALEAITQDTKEKLKVTEVDGPLNSSVLDNVSYNSTDFVWFQIDVTPVIKGGRSEIPIEVNEHHKRRKTPYPAKIPLTREQIVRFFDSRFLLSPYQVVQQESIYHFRREDIIHYTDIADARTEPRGIKYGPMWNVEPFKFDLIHLILLMPEPHMLLSEASKSVHVSHWGFISVDEYFMMENVGAQLEGEFSRVDFTKQN